MHCMRVLVGVLLLLGAACVTADEHDHEYENREQVVLWFNTVGPYHNRQETYRYFTLPFCRGPVESVSHHHESIGEALQGVELEFSGLDMKFMEDQAQTEYCSIELDESRFKALQYAIKNHYWYQMYLDDLPMWALVGDFGEGHSEFEPSDGDLFIWTHKRFDIGVNGNQIVEANLTTGRRVKLEPGITLHFSYQVNWQQSSTPFNKRFEKYLDPTFFQHRIHWFSIFNSFMMVIFLVGLVGMILMRTLRKDYARYSKDDELDDLERDLGDEYGWKQVHGDVFRPPQYPLLFASLLGTGAQVATVALIVILFAIVGSLYLGRGSILTTLIFVYAATSPVAGYFGGSIYSRFEGKEWIKQTLLTAGGLPAVVCGTAFIINFIAIYYRASRAIPFGTMLVVLAIWLFVVLPLTLVGSVLGRNMAGAWSAPCRINPVPRPIPEKKWFMEPWVIILLGGILPFGSIFIEMYFIFTSFWAYKIYFVYGFMLLVFFILASVTLCVTIVCTYFLLNAEDYRWHWTSFLTGASISIYVYMYSIYYFFFKTKMFGAFQTTFYFGYMAMFAALLGILCGTFGYVGSSTFVHQIYRNVKID
eukprot:m.123412 g.123412  ORF g.123412 m.123412 type:complete len:590 (+) comp16249_c0_seq1:245-2014(+)